MHTIIQILEQTCTHHTFHEGRSVSHLTCLVLCSDGKKYTCQVDNVWFDGSTLPVMSKHYNFILGE
jgi:hypothetical protein